MSDNIQKKGPQNKWASEYRRILKLAKLNDWSIVSHSLYDHRLTFYRGDDDVTMHVWYGRVNKIVTQMNHTKHGETDLMRRELSGEEEEKIFRNPRYHSHKGEYLKTRSY